MDSIENDQLTAEENLTAAEENLNTEITPQTQSSLLGQNNNSFNQASVLGVNKLSDDQLIAQFPNLVNNINQNNFKVPNKVKNQPKQPKKSNNSMRLNNNLIGNSEASINELSNNQLNIPGGEKFSNLNYGLNSKNPPNKLKSKQRKLENTNLNKMELKSETQSLLNAVDSEYATIHNNKHVTQTSDKNLINQPKENNDIIASTENLLNNDQNFKGMKLPDQVTPIKNFNLNKKKLHNKRSLIHNPVRKNSNLIKGQNLNHNKKSHTSNLNVTKNLPPLQIKQNGSQYLKQHIKVSQKNKRSMKLNIKKPYGLNRRQYNNLKKSHPVNGFKRRQNLNIKKSHPVKKVVQNNNKQQLITRYHHNKRLILNFEKRINSLMRMNEKLIEQIKTSPELKLKKTKLNNQILSFLEKVEKLQNEEPINKKLEQNINKKFKNLKNKFEDLEYEISEKEETKENQELQF